MPHFCGRTHSPRLRPQTLTVDSEDLYAAPTHEEIAALAYAYWEERGRPGGSPGEDWFRAERELTERRRRYRDKPL